MCIRDRDDLAKKDIAGTIKKGLARGKNSSIIIVCERERPGFSYTVQEELLKEGGIHSHVCVLGHIQRGGHPSHLDRFLGSRMGFLAVKALKEGVTNQVTASLKGHVNLVPFQDCIQDKIDYEKPYLELVSCLSI